MYNEDRKPSWIDENENRHPGTTTWQRECRCDIVPAGAAEVRDFSEFHYSDEWLVRTYRLGKLALRLCAIKGNDSPFVDGAKWEFGHKFVSVDILNERSGVYAIQLDDPFFSQNLYFKLIEWLPLSKVCLLEYEKEDVNYTGGLDFSKLQMELGAFDGIDIYSAEVALTRANIVYEAVCNEFFKGSEVALERFKKEKERIYWTNRFKAMNPNCEKFMGKYA